MSHRVDMVKRVPTMKITSSGQISLPAEVRRRWGVTRVRLVDHGDHVTLEPIPDDVFAATYGRFAGPGPTSDEIKQMEREAEAEREERRYGHLRRSSSRRRTPR
jgi:bifunctional DNA-binding transcriptional regulator/antitoxin component of YhaV-PrlF toxin-antitoxin module